MFRNGVNVCYIFHLCVNGTQEKLAPSVCSHACSLCSEGRTKTAVNWRHCMMMMTAVWDWDAILWALGATFVVDCPWLIMPQVAGPKTVSEMINLGSCFEFTICKLLSRCSSTSYAFLVSELALFSCSTCLLFNQLSVDKQLKDELEANIDSNDKHITVMHFA